MRMCHPFPWPYRHLHVASMKCILYLPLIRIWEPFLRLCKVMFRPVSSWSRATRSISTETDGRRSTLELLPSS